MKKNCLFFLLAVLVFSSLTLSWTAEVREEDEVFILDDQNFDEFVQNHDYLMVYFYGSDW